MNSQYTFILKNKWFVIGSIVTVIVLTVLVTYMFRPSTKVGDVSIPTPTDHCVSVDIEESEYDKVIINDKPVMYLPLSNVSVQCDDSFQKNEASLTGIVDLTNLPNGDFVFVFNGTDSSVTVNDNDAFSVSTTGQLTLEAWIRPDTLQFSMQEGSGYVHWMGKGEKDSYEYVARMYSYSNSENRPNRISGYAFNPDGGLGVGSYFQDLIVEGEWIYYVLVINISSTNETSPMGYTKIYKNGILQDQDDLAELQIIPVNGTAPFRIGTRDFSSFFEGAIGKVAIYDYELTETQILVHYQEMFR